MLLISGIVGIILLIVILYFCCRCIKCCSNLFNKLLNKICCNMIIRYSLEKSITISIACLATMKVMSFDNLSEGVSTTFSIIMIFLVVNILFFYPAFLNRNQKILRRTKFTKRCGSLTLNLRTKQFWPLMYHFFFIGRRLLLAVLIVFSKRYPSA